MMRKQIYRVLITDLPQTNEFLVSEDYLADCIQQHQDSSNLTVIAHNGAIVMTVENEVISDCCNQQLKEKLETSLKDIEANIQLGTWEPLQLFKISQEVFFIETYFVYSENKEQAEKDFNDWTIFEPIEISLVV
ncbi:hypothetical protein [Mesobacillus zeae]|uniref:hypothetical protein n=1 Tax=Mesobacillus zeae TaxID=1917180 RepID=UPI00300B2E21